MPDHDLVGLWETPTRAPKFDFATWMAPWRQWLSQPYGDHIPTMTGGVGHDQLKRFSIFTFISTNPPGHEHEADQPHGRERQPCR